MDVGVGFATSSREILEGYTESSKPNAVSAFQGLSLCVQAPPENLLELDLSAITPLEG